MDESDLRLTRLVARHFHDLQGLRGVVIGLALLPACFLYAMTPYHTLAIFATFAGLGAAIVVMPKVERYYASEFGRVEAEGQRWRNGWIAVSFVAMIADDQTAGWPSLLFIWWTGLFVWILCDSWPERRYYLLLVAVSLFGVATHTRVPAAISNQLFMAQTLALFSMALIVTGIADHLLMRRIFRKTGPSPDAQPL